MCRNLRSILAFCLAVPAFAAATPPVAEHADGPSRGCAFAAASREPAVVARPRVERALLARESVEPGSARAFAEPALVASSPDIASGGFHDAEPPRRQPMDERHRIVDVSACAAVDGNAPSEAVTRVAATRFHAPAPAATRPPAGFDASAFNASSVSGRDLWRGFVKVASTASAVVVGDPERDTGISFSAPGFDASHPRAGLAAATSGAANFDARRPPGGLAAIHAAHVRGVDSYADVMPSERQAPQGTASRADFRGAAEVTAGYAGFLDDALIDHAIVGGSLRYRLGRRVSVGPEIVYMTGPGTDRDIFVTGNVTIDFLVPAGGPRPGTISPYVVAGGGFMVHRSRFKAEGFSSTEGAVTGGGGVRVWVTERIYVVGQYRAGWEPHIRVDGGVGVAW